MEIEKIDANKFNLDEKKALTITQQFSPAIANVNDFVGTYEIIRGKEITINVCKEAKELTKPLGKVRRDVEQIRKDNKAFYLAGGKFVDAQAKAILSPFKIMEDNMKELANHYEDWAIEIETENKKSRTSKLDKYNAIVPKEIGRWNIEVFECHLKGVKLDYETKLKEEQAEKKRNQERESRELKLKIENNRLKREAEKIQKDEEVQIKAKEKRNNAPDKDKLIIFAKSLLDIELPVIEDKQLKAILNQAETYIKNTSKYIINEINK